MACARSASSRSNTGSPQPGGTPRAMTVTFAPSESPSPRIFHINSSSSVNARRIGAEEWIFVRGFGLHRLDDTVADLRKVAADLHAETLAQVLARDGTGGDAHHGLARRGAPAAAVVAKAVFLLVGVVGVTGTKPVLDLLVVARTRVGVLDEDADGRAGGAALEHTGEDLHRVGFVALTDELRRAGAAPVDVALQIGLAQLESRRAAVDDATQRGSVTLAEGRHREQSADRITRHTRPPVARVSAGILRRHRVRNRAR